MGENTIDRAAFEPNDFPEVGFFMTPDRQKFGAAPDPSPDLVHETAYLIEVLEKEYPQRNRDKIKRAIDAARRSSQESADRWQILQNARRHLGEH
jgi:hypothetical protein